MLSLKYPQSCHYISPTMKLLLVLLVALGVTQAAVTCDECQAAAQDFVSHLLSEESLAEQVQIMKDNVCPQVLLF